MPDRFDASPAWSRSWPAVAFVLGLIAATALFFYLVPPGDLRQTGLQFQPPFRPFGASNYRGAVRLPRLATLNRAIPPTLQVRENDKALRYNIDQSPNQTADAREIGVLFHASDYSDPNANGRTYAVSYLAPAVPLPAHLAIGFAALTIAFALGAFAIDRGLGGRTTARRIAMATCSIAYGAALLEGMSAILFADRFAGETTLQPQFEQVFDAGAERTESGSTANYAPHPYLDFALNPGPAGSAKRRIDPRYRIRRAEPLRPRASVAWRALALGGSTTYGALQTSEEDTWVYRLERKMRQAHGPDVDVINGGVSGYNVVENLIHYALLLDELEPDVVLLYIGINDVHPRLIGDIQPDYSNIRLPWRADETALPVANPAFAHFATYKLLMLRDIEQRRLGHIFLFVQKPYPPVREWPEALRRNSPETYGRHLRNLVRLIVAHGRKVIVVPQVFLPRLAKAYRSEDEIFGQAVAENNVVNEAVAREFSLPFAAEVATAFDRSELADNCHFNSAGAEHMAELLFRLLESEGSSPRPDAGR